MTTTTIDRFVGDVMRRIAPGIPDRERIELDLRMHLAERIEAEGDEVRALDRMGDPEEVARSFLAEIEPPLSSPGVRLGAFLFDAGLCLASILAAGVVYVGVIDALSGAGGPSVSEGIAVFLVVMVFVVPALLYFPVLEARFGQTAGKRLFGAYVARESGERAGLGAAVVRRLPLLFEFWFIDALFVPFTEKRQRAFDIIAKTVVVEGTAPVSRRAAWGWVLAPWLALAGIVALLASIH